MAGNYFDFGFRQRQALANQLGAMTLHAWLQAQAMRAAQEREKALENYRQLMLGLQEQRLGESQRYHKAREKANRERERRLEKYERANLGLRLGRFIEQQRHDKAEESARQQELEQGLSEFAAWRREHPNATVEDYLDMKRKYGREPMNELAVFLREHPGATVEDYLDMKRKYGRELTGELAAFLREHPHATIEDYWHEKQKYGRTSTGELATFLREHPGATVEDFWKARRKILGNNNLDALIDMLYGPRPTAIAKLPTTPRSTPSPTPSESMTPRPTASPTPSPALPSTSTSIAKLLSGLPSTSIVPADVSSLPSTSIVPAGSAPRTVNVPGLGAGMRVDTTTDGRPVYLFTSGKRLALRRETLRELNANP
jgi:hypothetical protein